MKTVKVVCPCGATVGVHHYQDYPNEFVEVSGECAVCYSNGGDYAKNTRWTEQSNIDRLQLNKLERHLNGDKEVRRGKRK